MLYKDIFLANMYFVSLNRAEPELRCSLGTALSFLYTHVPFPGAE